MDEKKYIDMLVEAGKDKKEATEFIKKVIATIKEKMPNAAPETQESVLLLKLDDILHGSNGDPYSGLCIGCDKMEDSFRYQKDQVYEAFKKDSNQAVMKGMVKTDESGSVVYDNQNRPIPLDTREFLDKKETKKNNNYGKPLPTQMRRQIIFVVDGKIVRAFGKEDPEIGKYYNFKATVSESGFFTLGKDSLKLAKEQPTAVQLWDAVYQAAGNSDYVTALCDIVNAEKNSFIVTKGLVKHTAETSNGGAMIVLKDGDCDEGVVGFSASEEAQVIILHEIIKGNEVITCGRVAKMKDGRTNVVTMGAIINPASGDISKGLDALGDLSI